MQENGVPLQQHPEHFLCVPVSGPPSLLATVPTERADQEVQAEKSITNSEEPEHGLQPDDVPSAGGAQPMRVFSPSLFTEMVCRLLCPCKLYACADRTQD